MNAIVATRRTYKELVDGTLRIQFDVEPKDKAAFLALFPNIDMPCALAPLIPGFEQASAGAEEKKPAGWKDLGPLCQSAIALCKDERFQKWIVFIDGAPHEGTPEQHASNYIRVWCGVESRRDLDKKPEAMKKFVRMFEDYREWLSAAH